MPALSSPRPVLLRGPRLRPLHAARVRRLDARGAHAMRAPRPRRMPRDSGPGSFMPGLSEDLSAMEVQVGYENPGDLGAFNWGRWGRHPHRHHGHHGHLHGMGALDVQSLLAPKNLAMLAGAAAVGYFLFKRK